MQLSCRIFWSSLRRRSEREYSVAVGFSCRRSLVARRFMFLSGLVAAIFSLLLAQRFCRSVGASVVAALLLGAAVLCRGRSRFQLVCAGNNFVAGAAI